MNEFFLQVINRSISAGWLILAVVILRLLLKRAPKWINMLLWGIVAIRLLSPFSIESVFSLIPSSETIPADIEWYAAPEIDSGIPVIDNLVNPDSGQSSLTPVPEFSANPLQVWIPAAAGLWLAGIAVLLLYLAASYWHLRRKVNTAVRYRDNIFQSEKVSSPFVLGMIRPRIYLPFQIREGDMEHVIAHEQAHIRRRDHWWKPIGFVLLAIYWFHPLIWLAWFLLCRDIELACDEKVIKELDSEHRADYTQALLVCSVRRRPAVACPLAFGEVGIRKRVKSVMNYRKPGFWIVLIAVIVCAAVAVCFLTNPIRNQTALSPDTQNAHVTEWFDYTGSPSGMEQELAIEIPEFEGAVFSYIPEQIAVTDASEADGRRVLITGMPIWNAYFCDLTGDGFPEICATLSFGSGLIDSRVVIFDYVGKASYTLEDRGNYDFTLRMDEGEDCLYVDVQEYGSRELLLSGRLTFDGGFIHVEGLDLEEMPDTLEGSAAQEEAGMQLENQEQATDQDGTQDTQNTESVIAQLLDTIQSSPAESSNPEDYIREHPEAYEALIEYGEDTLRYCFGEFLKGGRTDLRGWIMADVCAQIMVSGGEALVIDTPEPVTGQDWFEKLRSSAQRLSEQMPDEELERMYPVSWLLLEMMKE